MKVHIAATVRSCFAALRLVHSVRRCLPHQALLTLIRALVVSKVDYCCSVLAGVSGHLLDRLQSVLNAAARLIISALRSMASEWQTAFVVSHKMPWCALLTAVKNYNKSLEKLQDIFFRTETKTKCSRPRLHDPKLRSRLSFFVLESPRVHHCTKHRPELYQLLDRSKTCESVVSTSLHDSCVTPPNSPDTSHSKRSVSVEFPLITTTFGFSLPARLFSSILV